MLEVDGRDVRRIPLTERITILDYILTETDHFRRVMQIDGYGKDLFRIIKQKQLEGIVAKCKDSTYVGRRSDQWLKMINYTYADVKIAGFRKSEFGWLAQHNGKTVGLIELAVPREHRKAFYKIAQDIVTGEDKNFVYVQPLITARIRMRNWYKSGMMRTPEFVQFVIQIETLDSNVFSLVIAVEVIVGDGVQRPAIPSKEELELIREYYILEKLLETVQKNRSDMEYTDNILKRFIHEIGRKTLGEY